MSGARASGGRPASVAEAYDAIAPRYDRAIVDDRWMRRLLWRRHDAAFQPGQRVLDLGCGTGLDSLELARRGLRITALDVAPGMVARLRARLAAAPPGLAVAPVVADAGDLALFRAASFDGIVSSFAAVNTVPDWSLLAARTARLLRPGGRMILHLLAPAGLRGAGADGWGRVEIAGRGVPHRVRPLAEAAACFAPPFRLRRARSLGFLWPRPWGARLPAGVALALGSLELLLGGARPFRDRGRFQLLELDAPPRRS